jgi:hypothetical protein
MSEQASISQAVRKGIKFHFQPYKFEEHQNYVEKNDEQGKKRRYLQGISSGIKIDSHQERMTDKCIKSFMTQANAGNVLLYRDVHGIRASEDIGIMTKAEILPNGDWFTEYRLYDDDDDVDDISKQISKKIWNQMTGQPPYKYPAQKGFSIEGYIPDGSILSSRKDESGNITNRVIDEVLLDGVVLVPRPAYKDSIAHAVFKALGEIHPEQGDVIKKDIHNELNKIIQDREVNNEYYKKKWDLNDAMECAIKKIMSKETPEKQQALDIIFDEYKNTMIPLILQSESLFRDEEGDDAEAYGVSPNEVSKSDIFKSLLCELEKLQKFI